MSLTCTVRSNSSYSVLTDWANFTCQYSYSYQRNTVHFIWEQKVFLAKEPFKTLVPCSGEYVPLETLSCTIHVLSILYPVQFEHFICLLLYSWQDWLSSCEAGVLGSGRSRGATNALGQGNTFVTPFLWMFFCWCAIFAMATTCNKLEWLSADRQFVLRLVPWSLKS